MTKLQARPAMVNQLATERLRLHIENKEDANFRWRSEFLHKKNEFLSRRQRNKISI